SDCFPRFLTEGVRRDRAVGRRSERTLVERGDEGSEELPLADAPGGRAVHREIERVGEGSSEEFGPVVQRLQDVRRVSASLLADDVEDACFLRIVAFFETPQSHGNPSRPASSRSSPAATATETVCSKITSSE